ncbi:MAG: hypothetical protein OYH77_03535 [Pseudomonadota bacterium]|nr:hypothetical protein [Pseudomonadota bacterium]
MISKIKLIGLLIALVCIGLSCGEDKPNRVKEDRTLNIIGLADEVNVGTEISVEITVMNEDNIDADQTGSVRMVVVCDGKRVSEQNPDLKDGKVLFTGFAVNAVGDCVATLTSDFTDKRVIKFKVKEKVTVSLPPTTQPPSPPTIPSTPSGPSAPSTPSGPSVPSTPSGPSAPSTPSVPQPPKKIELPVLGGLLTLGKPFAINSKVALKVQPNSLCDNTVMLIYYNGSKVIETLTSGVHVPASNGKIEGLTFISLLSTPSISSCGKDGPAKSITMSIMPGFPQGLSAQVALPASPPSLAQPKFSDSAGIKLAWGTVTGFDNGAEIFFSNKDTGNEFVKHTGTVDWSNNKSVTTTLGYSEPVRALIRVKLAAGVHWLYYFKK